MDLTPKSESKWGDWERGGEGRVKKTKQIQYFQGCDCKVRITYPCEQNKVLIFKFAEVYQIWEAPKEGGREQ